MGAGAGEQVEEGVVFEFGGAIVEAERDGGGGFADHADAAVDDGVRHEAFAREGSVIARRPDGAAEGFVGDQRADAGGFGRSRLG